jgi:class 3 adenylate cyclase/tetratricopeptide (TPR) repeat protein
MRTPTDAEPPAPVSERRLVSVLFADLVGFTSLSESRDPDDVRELLSRYFDRCSTLIARYGGTVEKFIGDAVMAVWGTPVAQEDDAERAVRAALDLAEAVAALGEEVGASELRARVGVITGEASVTLGAQGQGMVAGDLVNTASRIQAAAPPGEVYVGDTTRRITEAAVVYEDAGVHELKGKAESLHLYRATRVIGGRGGALRSQGLESPFVGRDRELRMTKDLFHASAEEGRAHLLLVSGVAGIGKSRLSWELYKYIDGLQDLVWWHRGRCLSYGDGVTYWALAEMVRGRAGILDGDDPATAMAKLHTAVEEWIPDPEERAWVEPRLAHLLGAGQRSAAEPEDLFSAWRLLFERIAERGPTIMVFEDMQWADRALLDFIDYLMNWSRNYPLFLVGLARPELSDRHPEWALPRRGATTLHLEPLSDRDMGRLLDGLVPGLPGRLRQQIVERAEGVPLYAMETVRMLLDRGLLAADGSAYRLTGAVDTLAVPESLHALISARLDALSPEERAIVQDASVLGKTFTPGALAALGRRRAGGDLVASLGALVRKEIFGIHADPRSPERGQYGFLQDLVRKIAYETLSLRERRARHLEAASAIQEQRGSDDDEVVEVLAAHYLDAYRAMPDAPDAGEIKDRARAALVQAGQRSESLAAPREALRYYEQAIALTDDPALLAATHERAGVVAWGAGRNQVGPEHLDAAIEGFRSLGRERDAARAMARTGEFVWIDGRFEEAQSRMLAAYEVLADEPDESVAHLASQIGRITFFRGDSTAGLEWLERALSLAERLLVPEVLSMARNTKAVLLWGRGRRDEAELLLNHSLEVALRHDLRLPTLRAYNNLGSTIAGADRFEDELRLYERGLELARRHGDRGWEYKFLAASVSALVFTGRWDEALARGGEVETDENAAASQGTAVELLPLVNVHLWRGQEDEARAMFERLGALESSDEIQSRTSFQLGRALLQHVEGRYREAYDAAREAMEIRDVLGVDTTLLKLAVMQAADAALAMGDLDALEQVLAPISKLLPGERTPSIDAILAWGRARLLAARNASDEADEAFVRAVDGFRRAGTPFLKARVLLDQAEARLAADRADDAVPLLDEARTILEPLDARPYVERLDRLAPAHTASPSTSAAGG